MEIMNPQSIGCQRDSPDVGWKTATVRVESYLHAHGFSGPGQAAQLAAKVAGLAVARRRPGVEPVAVAMETLRACMASWYARALAMDQVDEAAMLARGRLALTMGGAGPQWAGHFLGEAAVPDALVTAMREADLGRGPSVKLCHMTPRLMPIPPEPAARFFGQARHHGSILRTLAGLAVVLSLIGVALAATF